MPILKRKLDSGHTSLIVKGQLKGTKYWETIPTGKITDARLREDEIRKEILDKVYKRKSDVPTLNQYIENTFLPSTRHRYRNPKTVRMYLVAAQRALGHLRLDEITPRTVREFIQQRESTPTQHGKQRTAGTIQCEVYGLSMVLTLAVEDCLLERNPCHGVRKPTVRPRKIEAYTPADIQALLAHCIGDKEHLRDIIIVGVNTGLRPGPSELFSLKPKHIDFTTDFITLTEHKTMHTGDLRRVPMNQTVRDILFVRAQGLSPDQPLFTYRDQPIRCIKRAYRALCKLAGLPPEKSRPYCLRHTALTMLAQKGVPLSDIRAIAGHRTIQVTSRYLHSTDDRMTSAVQELESVARAAQS